MAMSEGTPPPPPPPGGGYGSGGGYEPAPPPPPGYGPGPGYGGQPPGSNKKAIWASCSASWACCAAASSGSRRSSWASRRRSEIDSSGGMQTGRGMATAGFILGIIACIRLVVAGILFATGNNPYANLS